MRQRLQHLTESASGWEQFWQGLKPITPMGCQAKSAWRPFRPGEEAAWQALMDQQGRAITYLRAHPEVAESIQEVLRQLFSIEHLLKMWQAGFPGRLSDWFQLLEWLTQLRGWLQYRQHWDHEGLAALQQCNQVLEEFHYFQAEGDGGFTIPAQLDPRLQRLQSEQQELLQRRHEELAKYRHELADQYKLTWNQEGECWVPLTQLEELKGIEGLQLLRTTPFEAAYGLHPAITQVYDEQLQLLEERNSLIVEEILQELTGKLKNFWPFLLQLHSSIGQWELEWLAIQWALQPGMVQPQLSSVGLFCVEQGIHPLLVQQFTFTPISLELTDGVTILTGANMGGKSVALRTVIFLQSLVQYGFWVPAQQLTTQLFHEIYLLTGDGQDAGAGLSSFGFDLLAVHTILQQKSVGTSVLLCLDEFARGTNPIEGSRFARGVVQYLQQTSGCMTLFVTHFPAVLSIPKLRIYQTGGVRIDALQAELTRLTTEEHQGEGWWQELLAHLQGQLDYALYPTETQSIPQEALRIAKILKLYPPLLQAVEAEYKENKIGREEP